MRDMIDSSIRRGIELGGTLCERNGMIEMSEPCEGEECRIPIVKFNPCAIGDKIGLFHTHTKFNKLFPSVADHTVGRKNRIMCIGGMGLVNGKPGPVIRCYYDMKMPKIGNSGNIELPKSKSCEVQ